MNENVVNFFTRKIIANLPTNKKIVYQYILRIEDQLAEECDTKEQFLSQLLEKSYYQQAANHFQMSIDEIFSMLKEIEQEISIRLDYVLVLYKWMDYTNQVEDYMEQLMDNKRYFLVVTSSEY
ncbi:hypothetical protein [Sutcliffiella halmapala]|uniref:hypothetical protein n=1 Tax=Sutcliffiella halmapala TaxID=79882 RepID=UPI0009950FBA|nr:hypothetical protein [Sutcliffiella halmapala]